mgnify:CR=1 FL=1
MINLFAFLFKDKNKSNLVTEDRFQTPNQTKNQFDANWRRSNSSASNSYGNRSRSRNILDTFAFRSPNQFTPFSNGLHSSSINRRHYKNHKSDSKSELLSNEHENMLFDVDHIDPVNHHDLNHNSHHHHHNLNRSSSLDMKFDESFSSTAVDDPDESKIIVINPGVKNSIKNGISKNGNSETFEKPFVIVQFNKNSSAKLVA